MRSARTSSVAGLAVALALAPFAAMAQAPQPPRSNAGPSAATAGGSSAGQAMMAACRRDYAARCAGREQSPAIGAGCLSQYYISLSPACRVALDSYNGTGPATGSGATDDE